MSSIDAAGAMGARGVAIGSAGHALSRESSRTTESSNVRRVRS